MAKKVTEKTVREIDSMTKKPTFYTELRFVGGIDLSELTNPFFNRDHIFLRSKDKEYNIEVLTHRPSNDQYHTSLTASRRSGRVTDLGYLLSGWSEKQAYRKHKQVCNALKRAYFNL